MPDPSFIPAFDFYQHCVVPWTLNFADTAGTVLLGALVGVACGWVGSYLLLQGLALLGDALSHTMLLGIVLAALLTGEVSGGPVFIGATAVGLIAVLAIERLHTGARVKEDAAMGIVFTSMFALAVVLLSLFAGRAHLDAQHALFGDITWALAVKSNFLGHEVPTDLLQMAGLVAAVGLLVRLFYKELLAMAFDREFAAVQGLRPQAFRYGMLAVLALTVVGAFNSVGAVLVVALLIVPAATARLLTQRLPGMLLLAGLVGAASSLIGFHLAYWLEVSTGGAMVTAACGLFAVTFLFGPSQGLATSAVRHVRLQSRMSQENVIRHMFKLKSRLPPTPVDRRLLRRELNMPWWTLGWAVWRLAGRNMLAIPGGTSNELQLTAAGEHAARRLDRAHRLWEAFLVDQVGVARDHVHPTAETIEHLLSEQLVERLDDLLGHPVTDPHGAPIPRSVIGDQGPGVFILSKMRIGDRGRVVGLIDGGVSIAESGALAATNEAGVTGAAARATAMIAALKIPLGQLLTVVDRNAGDESWSVELADGRTIDLPHRLTDHLLVQLLDEPSPEYGDVPSGPASAAN